VLLELDLPSDRNAVHVNLHEQALPSCRLVAAAGLDCDVAFASFAVLLGRRRLGSTLQPKARFSLLGRVAVAPFSFGLAGETTCAGGLGTYQATGKSIKTWKTSTTHKT
jgi:hypothetical protein